MIDGILLVLTSAAVLYYVLGAVRAITEWSQAGDKVKKTTFKTVDAEIVANGLVEGIREKGRKCIYAAGFFVLLGVVVILTLWYTLG